MTLLAPNVARSIDPRSSEFVDQFSAFLAECKALDAPAIQRARRAHQQSGERFDLILTRLGLLPDGSLARHLAEFTGVKMFSQSDFPEKAVAADKLQVDFLKANHILPISLDAERISLAVADPFNKEAQDAIAFLFDREIDCGLASEGEIARAIDRLYGLEHRRELIESETQGDSSHEVGEEDVQRLEDMASEAPVIKLVRDLIVRAVEQQASDIHIEPREDSVQVRLRIDGILHTIETLSPTMRAALGSRIKIMARLNIAERRLPQDGRIKETVRGREIDLRVSTMPTMWGESIVLRILDRSSIELDFHKLGFAGESYASFRRLLSEPNGIILVTGPTGSGKTTTLYTALRELNSSERKIFTVEDPIEYNIAGINQIQVQPKIGLTFANALRSILRQDPDIIMVGEIRDLETAQIAVQASLTGHLVLSTVHTNSAAATVTRLLDMGVEKYLLASCLKGVLAQRLVRGLCPHCAVPAAASPALRAMLSASAMQSDGDKLLKPMGCPSCRHKGYLGRTTIYELLTMTPRVRDTMMSTVSDTAIEDAAIADGMQTMLQNGLSKAMLGQTTPEEVLRVTRFDTWQDLSMKPSISTES